jgi:hypothetical protein
MEYDRITLPDYNYEDLDEENKLSKNYRIIYSRLKNLENKIEKGHLIMVDRPEINANYDCDDSPRISVCDLLRASNWHFNTIAVGYFCFINNCTWEAGVKGVKTIIAQHNRIIKKARNNS